MIPEPIFWDLVKIVITAIVAEIVASIFSKWREHRNRRQSITETDSPRREQLERRSRIWRWVVYILSGVFIITAIVLVVVFVIPKISITITMPENNEVVESEIEVEGTSKNIPGAKKLWIVVLTSDGIYYPQGVAVNIWASGNWEKRINVGVQEHLGKEFDILAVLAGETAQQYFNDLHDATLEQESSIGIRELPGSTMVYSNVKVRPNGPVVCITETGKKYHRSDCVHCKNSCTPIYLEEAIEQDYEP